MKVHKILDLSGISCALVLLLIINCISCHSKSELTFDDVQLLSEGDKIEVITLDGKEHTVYVSKIEGNVIHGFIRKFRRTGIEETEIVLHAEEIKSLHVTKFEYKKMIFTTVIIVGVLFLIKPWDWGPEIKVFGKDSKI